MDRYSQFGLRGDADETLRRAVRDGFKRAGLGHAQLTHALEWYRDNVRPGGDGANLGESFNDFVRARGWTPEQLDAAVGVYSQIQHEGPAAVLAMPTAEEDAALIARADELLKTNADAYFRDQELQELALEARERQQAAPPPAPAVDDDAIERRIAQQDVDRFAAMLRDPAEASKYWASAELQRRHHDAIAASIRAEERGTAPAPAAQPAAPPAPAAPSLPAAAPAAPAPAKASDPAARRAEIETLMRADGGKAYWADAAVQTEYVKVLERLAAEPAEVAPSGAAAPAVALEAGAPAR